MMWGYGLGYWLGIGVSMVLLWGLVIAGIAALVHYIGGMRHPHPPQETSGPMPPEEVLAERFARGEIDTDEYKQRLDLLRARR